MNINIAACFTVSGFELKSQAMIPIPWINYYFEWKKKKKEWSLGHQLNNPISPHRVSIHKAVVMSLKQVCTLVAWSLITTVIPNMFDSFNEKQKNETKK